MFLLILILVTVRTPFPAYCVMLTPLSADRGVIYGWRRDRSVPLVLCNGSYHRLGRSSRMAGSSPGADGLGTGLTRFSFILTHSSRYSLGLIPSHPSRYK